LTGLIDLYRQIVLKVAEVVRALAWGLFSTDHQALSSGAMEHGIPS
jgi:hypothetical protein